MTGWWVAVLALCGAGVLIALTGLFASHWPEPKRMAFEPEAPIKVMTFDEYCEHFEVTADETPAAFAAYLNYLSGWDGTMQQITPEEQE